ncbi:MAG: carbon monoxide dehydrogenase subunit G [Alicyclobacillus herbarius]|uniref:SRPBCC family protein n=1 Tax=Alicyclobacillus herbarius TaxID=122960 RepID=UPI000428F80F|nr:carbon monoxide dehydrogenase subunit G [Alicyclobacillus herbarius]MCL6634099.1 carbon monoxide dehydrogenase subunit G [Alicyclobacillus herbarius]
MRTYEGEFTIEQPREKIWAFVTDPHKMGTCIPDLIELNVESETRFRTLVKVGVGPVRGKFDLTSELTVTEPGKAAALSIRGGGMGSGVDMKAQMELSDVDGGTLLKWRCDVVISGPIASLGGRLIDGEARKITEKVFTNLKNALLALPDEEVAATDKTVDQG